nr:MAG TPA: hypothetical protein [Caudoviricetes sp.]DAT14212.1 MAG TPA: hypothetical protein [Caudoviricetes sp.]
MSAIAGRIAYPLGCIIPLYFLVQPAEEIGHTSPVRVYLPLFGLLACFWV